MLSSKNEVYDFFSPPSSIRAIMPCRRTTKLQRQILARYPSNHRLSGCSSNDEQSNNENEEIEKFFTGYNDEAADPVLFTKLEEVEEFQEDEDDNDDDTCLILQSSFEAVLVEDDRVMPSMRKENLSFGCSVSTCSITSYSDDTISVGSNTTTTNTNTNTTNLSGRVFVVEEEKMEKRRDCMPNNDHRHRQRNKKQSNTTISRDTTIKSKASSRTRLKRQLSSKFLQRNKQLNSYKSREVQDFFTTAGIEIVLVEGEQEEEEEESHSLPSSPSLSSSLSRNIGRCRKHRHKVIDDDDDDKQKTVVGNGLSYDTYYVRSNTMVTGQ